MPQALNLFLPADPFNDDLPFSLPAPEPIHLGATQWTYWKSRFDRMVVEFDEAGLVNAIRD